MLPRNKSLVLHGGIGLDRLSYAIDLRTCLSPGSGAHVIPRSYRPLSAEKDPASSCKMIASHIPVTLLSPSGRNNEIKTSRPRTKPCLPHNICLYKGQPTTMDLHQIRTIKRCASLSFLSLSKQLTGRSGYSHVV